MESNQKDLIDKTDELIENREEQKRIVHPYRKYQIFILLSFIITIILLSILYHESKQLQEYLNQKDIALNTLQTIDNQSKGINQLLEIVDVNYYLLNNLDKRKNINIIQKPSEIYFLSSLISENNYITFDICYKSTTDGQSPDKFINNCGAFSPLVFLIETNEGYRFGIYISTFLNYNLIEESIYLKDDNAFIFSFNTFKKYEIDEEFTDYAIFLRKGKFPSFGRNDIYIGDNFADKASSFCEYPKVFKRNKDDIGDYILNGGIKKFVIKELEVLTPYIWDK